MASGSSTSQKISELESELSKVDLRIAEREKTAASTKDQIEASMAELIRVNASVEQMWMHFKSKNSAANQDLQLRLGALEESSSSKNADLDLKEVQMVADLLRSQLSLNTEEAQRKENAGTNRKMGKEADVVAHLEAELAWKGKRLASLEEALAPAESMKAHLESEIIRMRLWKSWKSLMMKNLQG